MANLTAIPTQQGLDILNSELKKTVTRFILIGFETHNNPTLQEVLETDETLIYDDIKDFIFYESNLESSYYDDKSVLTFNALIPTEQDLGNYVYAVGIITEDNKLVSVAPTPKIALISGMGGTFVIKVAVRGTAGEIVYKHSDYITVAESQDLYLVPIIKNTTLNISMQNILIEKGIITDGRK